MPAKIDTELNLRFLYICFKHSNFSTVDFHEVASYFQIKAPAARMRLMRLRQALEAESSREGFREKDRKRRLNPFKAKDKMYNFDGEEDDDDESLDDVPLMQRLQARLMRIKREEGSMIKNEDGTLIKNEDTEMIKSEEDGFWGKKEEGVDEQDDKDMAKAGPDEYGRAPKSEIKDSRSDLQTQEMPIGMEGAVGPGNIPSVTAAHHTAPYIRLPQMALGPQCNDYGYGRGQHTSTHLANFRAYGPADASGHYTREHNDSVKPEHVVNNNNYSTPLNGYNPIPSPDVFNTFAPAKLENTYRNARVTPPSGHDSSFRLDMFNAALTNPVTPGVEARPRQEYVDSVMGSPTVKDDVSETASDKFYPSPVARQAYQNHNLG